MQGLGQGFMAQGLGFKGGKHCSGFRIHPPAMPEGMAGNPWLRVWFLEVLGSTPLQCQKVWRGTRGH